MGKCKWCDRSGLFLSTNDKGICSNCSRIIDMDVNQRVRIIQQSIEITDKSKDIETRISRCDLASEHLHALLQYENKGINYLSTPPSTLIEQLKNKRSNLIIDSIKQETKVAYSKLEVLTTQSSKINLLTKLLLTIRKYKEQIAQQEDVVLLENKITETITDIQLKGYLENAQKAEFKGNNKKAIDQYYEALYLLQHDDIDDKLQEENISLIKNKISELTGKNKNEIK